MRWLLTLLLACSIATGDAQPAASPVSAIEAPPAAVVARHSARDVALDVVFAPGGALLNWSCTVSPHAALCAPTAAVAAWAGTPTWRRDGKTDVFRLPVAFWLPEEYERDAPGAPALMSETPRDALSPWRRDPVRSATDPQPELFEVIEQAPVLLGGLAELQSRVRVPDTVPADSVEGRVFVQFVIDERGRVLDTGATPVVCARAHHPVVCQDALRVVRTSRFIPGRQRGVPARVRYALPLTYRLPNGSAPGESGTE